MIISASYKTDLPAFYSQWFLNRLRAGYCKMVNPYGRQIYTVDLRRQAVDGFVFWTRNIAPFLHALSEVHAMGFPFVIQHGVIGYPPQLESSVVDPDSSIHHLRGIARQFGPRVVVWRYDTIVFSSLTSADWHLSNFQRIAGRLAGVTDEVVISFAQLYRKTLRNMNQAARQFAFSWHDPPARQKRQFASQLVHIANAHGIRVSVCSQPQYLVPGATPARCIDAHRLASIARSPICARIKGNRKECACFHSRDIGEYDTCPHGCVYCYAVADPALARRRFQQHDPNGEFLFPPTPSASAAQDQHRAPSLSRRSGRGPG